MVEWEKSIREGKWLVTDLKLRNESITVSRRIVLSLSTQYQKMVKGGKNGRISTATFEHFAYIRFSLLFDLRLAAVLKVRKQ